MRYNSLINNVKSKEWGLSIQEAYLFSWMYELPSWASKVSIENETFYFASKNKAVEDLPILTEKTDTMYRYYKKLEEKDLIVVKKIDSKDYIRLTNKAKKWNLSESEHSDKNPSIVGFLSENNSDLNPTYNTTIYNTNKRDSNIKKTSSQNSISLEKETLKKQKKEIKENPRAILFSKSEWMDYESLKNHLITDKKFVENYRGVDLKFYISKAEMWSENNPSKKRTNRGWLLTLRDWMRQSLENNDLKKITSFVEKKDTGFTNH